ncbi:2-amino-4-hydroxy-6-hydroxymethyldihydropteridine diphosphokinase [Nostoc sp. 3335mG]|nr:2-amino-4-hydroxy-6-hydroxymethyldihydropteridine diphosphokinase [Nostoc sp. 3335mG]
MGTTSYVIALGSNRRGRHGAPRAELAAALRELGLAIVSPILTTPPLGPSKRRFANAVAILDSDLDPPALLHRLKEIERSHGRRRGRRWDARVIDLDIILWSGGPWATRGLAIPHPLFRDRGFVLDPLVTIAPDWRDPISGRTIRQLHARLHHPR